jgi:hypothetical protein
MKDAKRRFGLRLMLGSALVSSAGCDFPAWTRESGARQGGPDWANLSLNAMVDRYGPPTRVEIGRVVWDNKGPWKRIVVWDDINFGQFLTAKDNNLQETLAYAVPAARRGPVEEFGGRILVSADGSELSARSYSEARNFLALNLADEVIRGAKTPGEARLFDAETLRLADAGKSSPYMKGLLFQAPSLVNARPRRTYDGE